MRWDGVGCDLVLTLKGVFDFDKLEVVGSVGAQYLVLVLWLVGFRPALTLPKALRLGGGGAKESLLAVIFSFLFSSSAAPTKLEHSNLLGFCTFSPRRG
jgi:hypothetical protein